MPNAKGTTVANNTPVGSAGQPFGALKKEVPEGKMNAIKRRMNKKKQESNGKSGGGLPKPTGGGY